MPNKQGSSSSHPRLDGRDVGILTSLTEDGRRPFAEIGSMVGMSAPSVFERVRKLESRGVIRGYRAILDPAACGYDVLAFSWVTQAPATGAVDLTDAFADIPEIEECHHVAGEADYLLKIRAGDTRHLERVVRRIQSTPNVFATDTTVVFSTGFERTAPIVPPAPSSPGADGSPETGPGGGA